MNEDNRNHQFADADDNIIIGPDDGDENGSSTNDRANKRQKTTTAVVDLKSCIKEGWLTIGCHDKEDPHENNSNDLELQKARALQSSYDKTVHDIRIVQFKDNSTTEEEEEKEKADEIACLLASFLRRADTVRRVIIWGDTKDESVVIQGARLDLLLQALIENNGSAVTHLEFHHCVPSLSAIETLITRKRRKLKDLVFMDEMPTPQHTYIQINMEIVSGKAKMIPVKISWTPHLRSLSTILPMLSLATSTATTSIAAKISMEVCLSDSTDDAQHVILGAAEILSTSNIPLGFRNLHSLRVAGTRLNPRRICLETPIDISPLLMTLIESPSISSLGTLEFYRVRFLCPSCNSLTQIAAANVSNLALKNCDFEDCYFDNGVSLDTFRILELFGRSMESLTFMGCDSKAQHQHSTEKLMSVTGERFCDFLVGTTTPSLRHLRLYVWRLPPEFLRYLGKGLASSQLESLELRLPMEGNMDAPDAVYVDFFRHLVNNHSLKKISFSKISSAQVERTIPVEALRTTLKENDTLCTVYPIFPKSVSKRIRRTQYDDEIELYLTMNRRGRQLIRRTHGIQSGFWPIILERQHNSSALYFFVRQTLPTLLCPVNREV